MTVKRVRRGWIVKNKYIVVNVDGDFYCTCPHFTYTGRQCKHIKEVIKHIKRPKED